MCSIDCRRIFSHALHRISRPYARSDAPVPRALFENYYRLWFVLWPLMQMDFSQRAASISPVLAVRWTSAFCIVVCWLADTEQTGYWTLISTVYTLFVALFVDKMLVMFTLTMAKTGYCIPSNCWRELLLCCSGCKQIPLLTCAHFVIGLVDCQIFRCCSQYNCQKRR